MWKIGDDPAMRTKLESVVKPEGMPVFPVGMDTAASYKHPSRNEDASFLMKKQKAFAVLDGMGGSVAGEIASQETSYILQKGIALIQDGATVEQVKAIFADLLKEADAYLRQIGKDSPNLRGLGTTATVVKLMNRQSEWTTAVIGHVGDSRAYILREDGVLEQVTVDDDSLKKRPIDLAQKSAIQQRLNNTEDPDGLDYEEQILFYRRNILTKSIGSGPITPDTYSVDIQDGEQLILLTDGIHDNLTDNEIAEIIKGASIPQEATRLLIEAAQARCVTGHPRAKKDDMTAIIVNFSPLDH